MNHIMGLDCWCTSQTLHTCVGIMQECECSPFLISVRFHWPMQGPQALASTVPPTLLKTSIRPSRSMVALICSLPGVMVKGTCTPWLAL